MVLHLFSWGTPPQEHLGGCPPRPLDKWCHVKNIIVRQKYKVVSIIQSINMVNLFLAELPGAAELIHCKTWLDLRKTWTQTQADQSLKIKPQRLVNVGMMMIIIIMIIIIVINNNNNNNNNNNGSEKLIIEIQGNINLYKGDSKENISGNCIFWGRFYLSHIQRQRNPPMP